MSGVGARSEPWGEPPGAETTHPVPGRRGGHTERMIFFGESSFRRAVSEFVEHYHVERAHQGLGNERIERAEFTGTGDVECSERLGGLLKHYRRRAA